MLTTTPSAQLKPKGKKAEHQGLCINCKHKGTCMFLRDAEGPVLFCETHEVESAYNPKIMHTPSENIKVNKSVKTSETYKGLCSNCSNRETCMIQKPEGGIWHCEEYA